MSGKRGLEVAREPVDHAGPPALLLLSVENVAADLPVQRNQFAICAGHGALSCPFDALLELGEPAAIVLSPRGRAHIFAHALLVIGHRLSRPEGNYLDGAGDRQA